MRELKFRAWAEISTREYIKENNNFRKEKRILKVHSVHFGTNRVMLSSDFGVQSFLLKNVELMQFTGLLDKNGKEIYEGDILQREDGQLDVVEWENSHFIIRHTKGDADFIAVKNKFEVIGNIYENVGLIK